MTHSIIWEGFIYIQFIFSSKNVGKIAESRRILQEHRTSHNRVFTSLDLMGQRKEGNLEGESVLQVDLLWDIGSLRQMHREGAKRISTMTSSSREDLFFLLLELPLAKITWTSRAVEPITVIHLSWEAESWLEKRKKWVSKKWTQCKNLANRNKKKTYYMVFKSLISFSSHNQFTSPPQLPGNCSKIHQGPTVKSSMDGDKSPQKSVSRI